MHILHVIDSLAVGGAERMLVDLANQSVGDGYDVSVCVTRAEGDLRRDLAPGIEVIELKRKKRFDWNALRRLDRFVRTRRVDALHVHGRPSFSLVALAKAAGLLKRPVLFHDHRSIFLNSAVPWWFRIAAGRFLDQYVGVYRELAGWARAGGVPAHRITIIPNALDLRRLNTTANTNGKYKPANMVLRPLGVSVGGLRAEKGTDTLLRALAHLPPDLMYSVVVAGGDADPVYAKGCRALYDELGLAEHVTFTGHQQDIPALLRSADFAVIPSRSESGPLVLIEYLAFGLPFVATRVGEISRVAEAQGLSEFVEPDDPESLAAALERVIRMSPEQRTARGELSRRVAHEQFDIQTVAPQWYELYAKMVA